MSLAPRLELSQRQSLVMTPQLQQAIKLLTLSNLEIESFVAEEVERNPLLEWADGTGERPATAAEQGALAAGDMAADTGLADRSGATEALDSDPGESFDLAGADSGTGSGGDGPDLDRLEAPGATLTDHLLAQAGESLAGGELIIARAIIDGLEETGYCTADLADLAQRLGVPTAEVERVLSLVQRFDPPGVAARSLAECLAIQAQEADRYDPCMAALIANLDLVAKGRVAELKRICGVDDEDFADMIAELRSYDPKPGCRFDRAEAPPIVPDVFVRPAAAGGWTVEVNGASLPRLLVNRRYRSEVSRRDKSARAWLSECAQSAGWLVKALDQRQRTIVRVASAIVAAQDGFFRHGVRALRPLTLRAVAEKVELHESTVSRVTSNKFLACDRGLFELKYFFSSGIAAGEEGDTVSAEAVKDRIARLIGEEGDHVLSDDALVDKLTAEGFGIARRTVAKYRESLGLGSSVQRRRQRALLAR